MDFDRFCRDFNIPVAPVGHKHHRKGWVNISCPFCGGGSGYPLGVSGNYFTCYRCSQKGHVKLLIGALLKIPYSKIVSLVSDYGGNHSILFQRKKQKFNENKTCKLPCLLSKIEGKADKYLQNRGFITKDIVRLWNISQTSFIGQYNGRIFIPIYYNNILVSYTCRSYVNSPLKYMSCKSEDEVIPHKNILYGLDNVPNRRLVIVVEGCFDVWRLGYGAVATFGTKVTNAQKNLLLSFERIVLLADGDDAGYRAWKQLGNELQQCGKNVRLFQMPDGTDAADIPQEDIPELLSQLKQK